MFVAHKTSEPKVELIKAGTACKNSHLSSLLAARDVSPGEPRLCLSNRNSKLMKYNLCEIWLGALIDRHSSFIVLLFFILFYCF